MRKFQERKKELEEQEPMSIYGVSLAAAESRYMSLCKYTSKPASIGNDFCKKDWFDSTKKKTEK